MADYNLGTARGRIQMDYDGKGIKEGIRDVDAYRDATGKLRNAHGQFVKDVKAADEAQKSFAKSTRVTRDGLQDVSQSAGVGALVIAGGLAYAAKKAIDFEKQIDAIGAVSGA